MGKFINYAHRGASEYFPENTILSFDNGIKMNANGIETDVQITKDGVLVIFHDDMLLRVTGESGSIKDYTYSEIQNFWVKKGEFKDKIPTLEEFLLKYKDLDLTFAIELKVEGVHVQTADIVKKHRLEEKVVITSFEFDYIKSIKEYSNNLKIGYLTSFVNDKILKDLKDIGGYEICPEGKQITAESVRIWHDLGFNVRAWGIYNQDIMKSVYEAGVDGMTVNFPDKLNEYIINNEK